MLGELYMWTVVYLATGLDEAKKVEQKLTEEGFW